MPELTPNLGLPIPPGGDSSVVTRDLRTALLGLDAALRDSGLVVLAAQWGANVTAGANGTIDRIGNRVTLHITGVTPITGTATDNGILTLPLGYRPSRQLGVYLIASDGSTRSAFVQVNGNLQVFNTVSGVTYRTAASITYITADAWPAA